MSWWILVAVFNMSGYVGGQVPMKLGPFAELAECQAAASQLAKTVKPDRQACIKVPRGAT